MLGVEGRGSRGFTGSFPSDKTNSGHDRSLEGENRPKKRAPDWLINITVYTVNVTPSKIICTFHVVTANYLPVAGMSRQSHFVRDQTV